MEFNPNDPCQGLTLPSIEIWYKLDKKDPLLQLFMIFLGGGKDIVFGLQMIFVAHLTEM